MEIRPGSLLRRCIAAESNTRPVINSMQGPLQIFPPLVINLEINTLRGATEQSQSRWSAAVVTVASTRSIQSESERAEVELLTGAP